MTYAAKYIPFETVERMVHRYRTEELHPSAANIEISELTPIEEGMPQGQGRAGVYAIYREDHTLIYFGMSLSNVANRISKHISRRVQNSPFWLEHKAELVQAFLVSQPWQAPSLEEYLIQQACAQQDNTATNSR